MKRFNPTRYVSQLKVLPWLACARLLAVATTLTLTLSLCVPLAFGDTTADSFMDGPINDTPAKRINTTTPLVSDTELKAETKESTPDTSVQEKLDEANLDINKQASSALAIKPVMVNEDVTLEKTDLGIKPASTFLASTLVQTKRPTYYNNEVKLQTNKDNIEAISNTYTDEQGVIWSADKTVLILIPEGVSGAVRIGKEVKAIEPGAFSHCDPELTLELDADNPDFYIGDDNGLYSRETSELVWGKGNFTQSIDSDDLIDVTAVNQFSVVNNRPYPFFHSGSFKNIYYSAPSTNRLIVWPSSPYVVENFAYKTLGLGAMGAYEVGIQPSSGSLFMSYYDESAPSSLRYVLVRVGDTSARSTDYVRVVYKDSTGWRYWEGRRSEANSAVGSTSSSVYGTYPSYSGYDGVHIYFTSEGRWVKFKGGDIDESYYVTGSMAVEAPIPYLKGYYFLNWTTTSAQYSYVEKTTLDPGEKGRVFENGVTYTANWHPKTYAVSFDANGGEGAAYTITPTTNSSNYYYLDNHPTRRGYTFKGYYTARSGGTQVFGPYELTRYNNLWGVQAIRNTGFWDNSDRWCYDGDITLYAQWDPNWYDIRLDLQGGSEIHNHWWGARYDGDPFYFHEAPVRTGYTFRGFYTAPNGGGTQVYGAVTADGYTYNVNDGTYWRDNKWIYPGSVTLYAYWESRWYTMVLDLQGGREIHDHNWGSNYDGSAFHYHDAPVKTGYIFNGFYTEANGRGTRVFGAVRSDGMTFNTNDGTYWRDNKWIYPGDVTLYAYWERNTYTITLDKQGGSGGTDSFSITYDAGGEWYCLDAPSRPGYSLCGYYTQPNGQGTKIYYTYTDHRGLRCEGVADNGYWTRVGDWFSWTYANNLTLYAQWQKIDISFTLDANGGVIYSGTYGGSCTHDRSSTHINTSQNITVYTFHGATGPWVGTGGIGQTAYWDPCGESFNWHYSAWRPGYTLQGFSTSPTGSPLPDEGYRDANTTYYAIWQSKSYTVTLDVQGGNADGLTTVLSVTTGSSNNNLRTAPIKEGYTFLGYYSAPTGGTQVFDARPPTNEGTRYTSAAVPGTVYWDTNTAWCHDGDATFYAQWQPIKYNLSFDTNAGGDSVGREPFDRVVSGGNGLAYDEGYKVLNPKRYGYMFAGWEDANTHELVGQKVEGEESYLFRNLTTEEGVSFNLQAKWTLMARADVQISLPITVSVPAPLYGWDLDGNLDLASEKDNKDALYRAKISSLTAAPLRITSVKAGRLFEGKDTSALTEAEKTWYDYSNLLKLVVCPQKSDISPVELAVKRSDDTSSDSADIQTSPWADLLIDKATGIWVNTPTDADSQAGEFSVTKGELDITYILRITGLNNPATASDLSARLLGALGGKNDMTLSNVTSVIYTLELA